MPHMTRGCEIMKRGALQTSYFLKLLLKFCQGAGLAASSVALEGPTS